MCAAFGVGPHLRHCAPQPHCQSALSAERSVSALGHHLSVVQYLLLGLAAGLRGLWPAAEVQWTCPGWLQEWQYWLCLWLMLGLQQQHLCSLTNPVLCLQAAEQHHLQLQLLASVLMEQLH